VTVPATAACKLQPPVPSATKPPTWATVSGPKTYRLKPAEVMALNNEGVHSPSGGTRWGDRRRGWAPTTIKSVLENERYLGRFTWNKRRWIRSAGTRNRLSRARPAGEWITTEAPELALVTHEQWDAARERWAKGRKKHPGRPFGTGTTPSLLAGLLRCASCGGGMTIVGRVRRGEHEWAQYGCRASRKKGKSFCSNRLCVSERKVERALLDAIRDTLREPDVLARVVQKFNETVAHGRRAAASQARTTGVIEAELAEQERRIRNVSEALAKMGDSEALREKLGEEEAKRRRLAGELKTLRRSSAQQSAEVQPQVVAGYVTNLVDAVRADPEQGNKLLVRHLGPVVMTPRIEGSERFYEASANFAVDTVALSDHGIVKAGCGGKI
jgi:hypothetical protein